MSTRLAEIKMEHDLNDLDFATLIEAIDDPLPVCRFIIAKRKKASRVPSKWSVI